MGWHSTTEDEQWLNLSIDHCVETSSPLRPDVAHDDDVSLRQYKGRECQICTNFEIGNYKKNYNYCIVPLLGSAVRIF